MDSFWKHVIIYVWIVWSFLYMEMSTTPNSLKKNSPESRPAPAPPLKTIGMHGFTIIWCMLN